MTDTTRIFRFKQGDLASDISASSVSEARRKFAKDPEFVRDNAYSVEVIEGEQNG